MPPSFEPLDTLPEHASFEHVMESSAQSPFISIITPCLNSAKFLEGCIQNVVEQGAHGVEHVIVDGGSKDGTHHILRAFPHVKWVSEPDSGQSNAMNKGLRMASGRVVSFLNADDFYGPGTLRRIQEIFRDLAEPSFIQGACNVWGDGGELLWIDRPRHNRLTWYLAKVADHSVNPSAYFYHKSLHNEVGYYDESNHNNMDAEFLFRVAARYKIRYYDEVWGNFRLVEGTKTKTDIQSGLLFKRQDDLISRFYSQLGWRERTEVLFLRAMSKAKRTVLG
jgi:glycosyltransferase involved in cell wall biosynthesis